MELGSGVVLPLVIGFPLALFTMLWVLGRLEAWMLQPDERAAAVQRMLAEEEQVEALERAVAELMAQVADDHRREPRRSSPRADRIGGSIPVRSGVS